MFWNIHPFWFRQIKVSGNVEVNVKSSRSVCLRSTTLTHQIIKDWQWLFLSSSLWPSESTTETQCAPKNLCYMLSYSARSFVTYTVSNRGFMKQFRNFGGLLVRNLTLTKRAWIVSTVYWLSLNNCTRKWIIAMQNKNMWPYMCGVQCLWFV